VEELVVIFSFVILCMLVIRGTRLLEAWLKHRKDGVSESLRSDTAERLAGLEERVRILERIVTDDKADLRRQFRDLDQSSANSR